MSGALRAVRVRADEWDGILAGYGDATVYQSLAYGLTRFGAERLEHVVFERAGSVEAAAQVHVVVAPALRAGIARIVWGPLVRRDGRPFDPERLAGVLDAFRIAYAGDRGLVARAAPHVLAHEDAGLAALLEGRGWQRRGETYRTFVLDLDAPLEQLRKRLREGWRRNLKRGEAAGLELEEGSGDELFQPFLALYQEMLDRKRFAPGVDAWEFSRVQQTLPEASRMRVFLARAGGTPVAAVVCSCMGDTGVYLLGATGDAGLDARASYLLHWRAVEWLLERGASRYDLGGCHPVRNPGTYQFKAGMGGADVTHAGEFQTGGSLASRLVVAGGEGAQGAREALRGLFRRGRTGGG